MDVSEFRKGRGEEGRNVKREREVIGLTSYCKKINIPWYVQNMGISPGIN